MTEAFEKDDYGTRADGGRNLWVTRIVAPPVAVKHKGSRIVSVKHGGQIEARVSGTLHDALGLADNMQEFYRPELLRGACIVVEPGLYSAASMPGACIRVIDARSLQPKGVSGTLFD